MCQSNSKARSEYSGSLKFLKIANFFGACAHVCDFGVMHTRVQMHVPMYPAEGRRGCGCPAPALYLILLRMSLIILELNRQLVSPSKSPASQLHSTGVIGPPGRALCL